MRGVFLLMALLVVISSSATARADDADIQRKVQALLAPLHPADTPDDWRALGPDAPRVIIAMIGRTDRIRERHRLTSVLGYFPDDPAALAYLKRQAEGAPDEVIRVAAVRSVGQAAGVKESSFVAQFLASEDPDLRVAAGQTLRQMNDPQAEALLEPFLAKEGNSRLAARIQGQPPRVPVARLKPTGSTESRPAPGLPGAWRGFRVMPDPRSGQMRSEACTLRLQLPARATGDKAALQAELFLTPAAGGAPLGETVTEVRGEGQRLSGRIRIPGESDPVEFSGQVREQAGVRVLELRVPRTGALYLLRKD